MEAATRRSGGPGYTAIVGEFSKEEIAEMAAETGLSEAQVRETLAGSNPDEPDGGPLAANSATPGDGPAVTGLAGHRSTQRLAMPPQRALQEVVRTLEQALNARARFDGDTRATVSDIPHGIAYHVEASRDDAHYSVVTVHMDPTVARHRALVTRSGAVTNAIVGASLLVTFGFPTLLTAVAGTIIGAGFWFSRHTRSRGLAGLAKGRGLVASALIGAEDRQALPPVR
jgi:hypothetical protein